MLPESPISAIAHVIQRVIAPVFLVSGVATLLSVLTNRLDRIVERARGGVRRHNPMQRRIYITALLLLMTIALSSCGTSNDKTNSMKSKQDNKASGGLESDPRLYKHNSVMGAVKSGGKAVPGATVTIVATKENFPIEASGSYILVLDPAKLGRRPIELLFAAPGYVEQRHSVLIPENKQIRLDVELVPAK